MQFSIMKLRNYYKYIYIYIHIYFKNCYLKSHLITWNNLKHNTLSQARGCETPLFPIYCYVAKLMTQTCHCVAKTVERVLVFSSFCLCFPQPPSLGKMCGDGGVHPSFSSLVDLYRLLSPFRKTHCHEPHPWNLAGNYPSRDKLAESVSRNPLIRFSCENP